MKRPHNGYLTSVLALGLMLTVTTTWADELPTADIDFAGTWVETPYGQPVIDRGPSGRWDHAAVDNPYVYTQDGKFYCFFEAQDVAYDQEWHERIGLAVSTDGACWTKCQGNPILDIGEPGSWDSVVVKLPAGIVKDGHSYRMFYSGRDNLEMSKSEKGIGMATARQLEGPWQKSPENPVLRGREDRWDKKLSTLPVPLFQQHGQFWMLFRGMEGFYHHQGLSAATSSDLVKWKRVAAAEDQPLIPTVEEIASFAVAKVNGRYVAISQPMKLSQRRYWLSPDLIHWSKGTHVKMHVSVVAETISNPFLVDGQWNVLYEQKDRIYRAILTDTIVESSRGRLTTPRK